MCARSETAYCGSLFSVIFAEQWLSAVHPECNNVQHLGKKTTLRLMCPQTQVLSEVFSCFKMINVAIFAHHLVRMQGVQKRKEVEGYLGLLILEICPALGLQLVFLSHFNMQFHHCCLVIISWLDVATGFVIRNNLKHFSLFIHRCKFLFALRYCCTLTLLKKLFMRPHCNFHWWYILGKDRSLLGKVQVVL